MVFYPCAADGLMGVLAVVDSGQIHLEAFKRTNSSQANTLAMAADILQTV